MRFSKFDTTRVMLSHRDKERKITIPTVLNEELSELCGIHIADGHMNYYPNQRHYVIQWGGNPKSEKPYYNHFIKQLWKRVFNAKIKLCLMDSGAYGFWFYSKGIFGFLNDCMSIEYGDKTKTVRIPSIIKNTCKECVSNEMIACLRGIIDNDFFLSSAGNDWCLGAWFASRNLVLDLHRYFGKLGIHSKLTLDDWYFDKRWNKFILRHGIRIRRKGDISKWYKIIGSHNQKIYKKYFTMVDNPIRESG